MMPSPRFLAGPVLTAMLLATLPAPVDAQPTERDLEAMASWVAVDAATGYESRVAPALAAALPGWRADAWGNVLTTVGAGSPHHVVACALDRPSYAISQITDDGYLRVHRIGRGSRHPLWDQQFEAQQVRVLTATGPVTGVVARSNGHFAPQHRRDPVATADDLWVDVGAESRADVDALGIALLDPIARHLPPWPMAGAVAGPDAGRRTGCAAVVTLAAAASRASVAPGRTTFVLSSQEGMGWVGLSSLVARSGGVDRLTILAPGEEARLDADKATGVLGSAAGVFAHAGLKSVRWLAPAVLQAGSHLEVLRAAEAGWLLDAASTAVGVRVPAAGAWVPAPPRAPLRVAHMDATLAAPAAALTALVERPGVSAHEWSVRRAVLEALPAWARERAAVDDIGNIMMTAGPDGAATVFMAHLDEIGYVIESIAEDGTATLTPQGGVTASAWEGQTALVHVDPPAHQAPRPGAAPMSTPAGSPAR